MGGVRSLLRAFFFSVCSFGQAYNEKGGGVRFAEAMFCIFSAYIVELNSRIGETLEFNAASCFLDSKSICLSKKK